ncbi:protein NRDE2 homolog isoform X2 [Vigna radiata var. radiata]|uniref:Protein NRDE2 homolog isoform X2 n=1 Tax=Vigna radiata var. radiata TaxID=3916 RepID=A0A1S3V923_VIGRR|nr:protein NRDE2 homolog isoform X2 [Vigna radiata var. radiata]
MEQNPPSPAVAAPSSDEQKPSLFPLFPASSSLQTTTTTSSNPQWLCNSSFTTDISVINDAVASQINREATLSPPQNDEDDENRAEVHPLPSRYEILESSESDGGGRDRERRKKKKKKKRRRDSSAERGGLDAFGSRKSRVRVWADSESNVTKDYYFDSHGDRDNLAFGCIYRMDVARYKPYNPLKLSGLHTRGLYWWNRSGSLLDRDGDVDALDAKMKSAGRYWSGKYMALERHKSFKRIHLVTSKLSPLTMQDEFIPLSESDAGSSLGAVDSDSVSKTLIPLEESWEDEMLNKTREFNKLTREHPHDGKVWLAFAEFQDKVAGMQRQKAARLQTLEKKISILEKAVELNPDNEEILLCLLKAYQMRDSSDVLIARWEKILLQHYGSCKLWGEFLLTVQRNFSRFKVSEVRKMYVHAIEALSASCSKHSRQVLQGADPSSSDPAIVELELGLVDIFLSLCRFEWQAGYRELATALFQAEIEFSLFCPPLLLTEQRKHRLFKDFWNSGGARVGEEGALGWSTWLEKEEETRQKVINEELVRESDGGGWTGWSEPRSKDNEDVTIVENEDNNDVVMEDAQDEEEYNEVETEVDTENLLKMLGIDINDGDGGEVNDTATWIKWSKEESSRDCDQWMPVRRKSDTTSSGAQKTDEDDQLLRVVLYEDVNEYLFSLRTTEARLSLLSQFIDFYGGKMSQMFCSNSPTMACSVRSLENLPDSMLEKLKRIHEVLTKTQNTPTGFSIEFLSNSFSRNADIMKFIRNAVLLCLTVFPRNYMLEEAVLISEELYVTKMNSSNSMVTPCRSLAKSLLKNDRQDVLLCGVYARREAAYGNIDHARKVFDMALLSVEALPGELQSNSPLLYFWYAEVEVANNTADGSESSCRAIHILSCLGSGTKYSPFKSQASGVQLLRAHQGFKEKLRTVWSSWVRGIINDQSVALICSAALFEELTTGWDAGIEVLNQAFSMVLPERRSQGYQLEFLFNYHIKILQRHQRESSLMKVWESILHGLQIYPFSPELLKDVVEVGHHYTTSNKLRRILDDCCYKKPSVVLWLFALSFEMFRGGSQHRIRGLFEKALSNDGLSSSVVLWRCYIMFEMEIANDPSAARRAFFRAIHSCPWSKRLWLDGFLKLNSVLTAKELSDLQEVMRDKELNLRTDIYEILLQES